MSRSMFVKRGAIGAAVGAGAGMIVGLATAYFARAAQRGKSKHSEFSDDDGTASVPLQRQLEPPSPANTRRSGGRGRGGTDTKKGATFSCRNLLNLAENEELLENVSEVERMVAQINAAAPDYRVMEIYAYFARSLDRLCEMHDAYARDETYEPGMAAKSLRYVSTVREALSSIKQALRQTTPTLIEPFSDACEHIEAIAGDMYHNLAVQEMISMENPRLPGAGR